MAPHLNVYSDSLVYLQKVPVRYSAMELKHRISNSFGPVLFVETFEAWKRGRRTGDIILDFAHYSDSMDFTTEAINHNIGFLGRGEVQHVAIVTRRGFFKLVHRNTGVDLWACGGNPRNIPIRRRNYAMRRPVRRRNYSVSPIRTPRGRDRERRSRRSASRIPNTYRQSRRSRSPRRHRSRSPERDSRRSSHSSRSRSPRSSRTSSADSDDSRNTDSMKKGRRNTHSTSSDEDGGHSPAAGSSGSNGGANVALMQIGDAEVCSSQPPGGRGPKGV